MSKQQTQKKKQAPAVREDTFFFRQRYFLFFFAFFIVYQFSAIDRFRLPATGGLTYTYHLLDYSFGFCARFLPGAVFNFLTGGDAAVWKVTAWDLFLTLALFAFVSYALQKLILSFDDKQVRRRLFALGLFFVSGAFTFAGFAITPGLHDVNWLLISAAFLFALGRKYLRLSLPLLAAISALIHYSALVSYLILFALLLLFEASARDEKKEKRLYLTLFFLTVFACAAASLYLIATEKKNLVYDIDAFERELARRDRSGEASVDDNYFKFALYGDLTSYEMMRAVLPRIRPLIEGESSLPPALVEVLNKAWQQVSIHIETIKTYPFFNTQLISELLMLLPALAFLGRFWVDMLRRAAREKDRLAIFVYLCAVVQFPFMVAVWRFMSWDKVRYVTNAFLIEAVLALYVMYRKKEDAAQLLGGYLTKENAAFAAVYYVVYASFGLNLYS